jgi:hypothetical protein
MIGSRVAAVGVAALLSQCAPASGCAPGVPGHPPDCNQRDTNGDGYPDNGISASGVVGTCRFSRSFQRAVGRPLVWVEAVCRGDNYWTRGAYVNVETWPYEDVTRQVFCLSGFDSSLVPRSAAS